MQYQKSQTPIYFKFRDDTETYLLPREKFEIGVNLYQNLQNEKNYERELKIYNKKVERVRANNGKKLPKPPKKPDILPTFAPVKASRFNPDFAPLQQPEANVLSKILTSKQSYDFVKSISCEKLEEVNFNSLMKCDVQKTAGAPISEDLSKKKVIENTETVDNQPKSVTDRIKDFSLEVWILMACRVFKSIPNLIALLDLDVKRIAFNSPRLSERGVSTIRQLEALTQYAERKEQYLNLYVLNKIFAGLLKSPLEREVFLIVFQRSKDIKQLESQKLRTAYRIRRTMLKRFKEFCLSRGYDKEWFFEHFGNLPPIRYFAEHHGTEKRLEELRLAGGDF